jgi:hypothetical protein
MIQRGSYKGTVADYMQSRDTIIGCVPGIQLGSLVFSVVRKLQLKQ